jgi:hypothetical protein
VTDPDVEEVIRFAQEPDGLDGVLVAACQIRLDDFPVGT